MREDESLGRRLSDLEAPLAEHEVEQLWRGATARRGQRKRRRALLAGASALLVLAVVGTLSLRPWGSPDAPIVALRLEGGALATEAPSEHLEDHALRFDDGSVVEVRAGSRLSVLSSLPEGIRFDLSEGSARYDVVPGGGRSWEIRCGAAEVRVLGTAFVLTREGSALRVEVERGRVGVTGPDTDRTLGAGDVLVVERAYPEAIEEAAAAPVAEVPLAPIERVEEVAAIAPRRRAVEAPEAPSSWRELGNAHAWSEAYDSLGADGVRALVPDASVEDLFLLADLCRSSRHPAEAVLALDRIVDEHPEHPGAAIAAYTLGTLEMDRLHHPDRAARAFDRALSLGLPSGMVADAQARRARAEAEAVGGE